MATEMVTSQHIFILLLSIVVTVSLPLILILLLPLYLLRFLVKQLAKIFRRGDLGQMVTIRSNYLFCREYPEMFMSSSPSSIYVSVVIDGNIPLQACRQLLLNKIVNVKKPGRNNHDYMFPELRQSLTTFLGYLFWQWDTNFCIHNHVNMYKGPGKVNIVSETDMMENMKELVSRPFVPGQSPWEVWLWNNARFVMNDDLLLQLRPKTIMILRVFHGITDGVIILNMLVEEVKISTNVLQLSSSMASSRGGEGNTFEETRPRSLIRLISKSICFPLKAPFELVSTFIQSLDDNEWGLPQSQLNGTLCSAMTQKFSVHLIKYIENIHETRFQTVILAAFAGGIRNFMTERGIKIPATMSCQISLPFSTHLTDKLRNKMTQSVIPLPIGVSDPVERLRSLDESLRRITDSTVPFSLFYLIPCIGTLPHKMLRLLPFPLISSTTCVIINYPGPVGQAQILGHCVDDITFVAGCGVGNTGVGAGSFTYNGGCRLFLGVDDAIIWQEEYVQNLVDKMKQELCVLGGLESV